MAAEPVVVDDAQDFADADRGYLGTRADRQIRATDGRVVWDLDAYAFLDGPAPDTAHPSLWRQGQLCAKDGLFEVVPGHLPGARLRPVEHDVRSRATTA